MTVELQSSETPRVTTDTTIGCCAGEYSKQNLAQRSSAARTWMTPASKAEAKSTLALALNRKLSSGGLKSAAGAVSLT